MVQPLVQEGLAVASGEGLESEGSNGTSGVQVQTLRIAITTIVAVCALMAHVTHCTPGRQHPGDFEQCGKDRRRCGSGKRRSIRRLRRAEKGTDPGV